ncbi:beta-lactamase-like protein [Aspergillus unguis]
MVTIDQEGQPSFASRDDHENSSRGFICALNPCVIRAQDGRVVWDADQYSFLHEDCPPTANPKLWRHAQLCAKQGLFEIASGIFQVRGLDISNMTLVEGREGVIVIDPLISAECAAAALKLYRKHRGNRPVTGLIYSHSHTDHFGGARGVLPSEGFDPASIPIIAPDGFLEEVLSENMFAGPAMRRRAAYMFGGHLVKGPGGQICSGLGMCNSTGTSDLVPPNVFIKTTGEEKEVDGVRIVFQMVPGTEAPAEINFFFPDHRALCIAECATHCLHNIITLRGAQVRDSKAWSKYLDETLTLFGDQTDLLFASHHWPTWGQGEIIAMISQQRDMYTYLHDQTCRMMNDGLNGTQIAERIQLPAGLKKLWHLQGFYGSVSHNVKGIYQRYMTWFDGNSANLWKHPPEEEAKRYVDCIGGIDAVVTKALRYRELGDLRFAATLLDHALSVDPTPAVKDALASVYEELGYGAENATWRNFYLTSAQDLRETERDPLGEMAAFPAINPSLSVGEWLDALSIRLNGLEAQADNLVIDILIAEQNCRWRVTLANGALTYRSLPESRPFRGPADLSLTMSKAQLADVLRGDVRVVEAAAVDWRPLLRLLELLHINIQH